MASVKPNGSDKSVIKQAMQFDEESGQYSFVGPTIVYCLTRKDAENIKCFLQGTYH